MGGDAGLRRLIAGAHELGAHIMLMFGINFANVATENFEQWGAPAALLTAGGYPASGSVDWDGSRHYDHGRGRILNPAAPTWQHRLSSQINSLLDTYGFDGVFLDISAMWANDPRYNTYDGIRDLVRKIQKGHPDVLIAGEGWYDAMGAVTPLVQAGHTDGVHHWHDQPHADFFNRYNRQFAHLCLGDPGLGSTGVHELGHNPIQRVPLREGVLPTICIVEDTFEVAPEQSRAILADANEYAHRYLPRLPTKLQPGPINQ